METLAMKMIRLIVPPPLALRSSEDRSRMVSRSVGRCFFFWAFIFLFPAFLPGRVVSSTEAVAGKTSRSDTLVLFRFRESDPQRAAQAGRLVSLDRREGDIYTAYANRSEMQAFREAGFEVGEWLSLEKFRPKAVQMAGTVAEMAAWDRYPTYAVYLEMMRGFASRYPQICRLDTIGFSVENRLILCLKISDSVDQEEAEPGFFYSSSIHGDELTGFVLMLRLADYLLSRYGQDGEVTRLLDEVQLYINPLANPDGTYGESETDVSGSVRYNARFVDLNRNYPDPWKGDISLEAENRAMIAYMERIGFAMSVNLHGGSDVLNFPWDSFRSSRKRHADYDWWTTVCRRYVDSCRRVEPSSYRDVCEEGYIHGGDWYVVSNGRQDYVNYYRHARELTLEISVVKCPPASQLPRLWDINYRSLINHIKAVTYGIRGKVFDSLTGLPLRARISVIGHDSDSSQVYSSALHGTYFRPIADGLYDLLFEAPGYRSKRVENLAPEDFSVWVCDAALVSDTVFRTDTLPEAPDTLSQGNDTLQVEKKRGCALAYAVAPNPVVSVLKISASGDFRVQAVLDACGRRKGRSYPAGRDMRKEVRLDFSAYAPGWYGVRVEARNGKTSLLKVMKR